MARSVISVEQPLVESFEIDMLKTSLQFGDRSDTLTDPELLEIEARCQSATQGPWSCPSATTGSRFIVIGVDKDLPYTIVAHTRWSNSPLVPEEGKAERNALFIAHAREDILRLISEVRRLRRERQAFKQVASDAKIFLEGAFHDGVLADNLDRSLIDLSQLGEGGGE